MSPFFFVKENTSVLSNNSMLTHARVIEHRHFEIAVVPIFFPFISLQERTPTRTLSLCSVRKQSSVQDATARRQSTSRAHRAARFSSLDFCCDDASKNECNHTWSSTYVSLDHTYDTTTTTVTRTMQRDARPYRFLRRWKNLDKKVLSSKVNFMNE